MASNSAQVKCINKTNRLSAWERISHIGGGDGSGRWKLPLNQAIGMIERGEWSFFVQVGGRAVYLVVATSAYGNKYLKTTADGEHPNNLLSLPECP